MGIFDYKEDGRRHFAGLPHKYFRLSNNDKVGGLIKRDRYIIALQTALRDCYEHMYTNGNSNAIAACERAEELLRGRLDGQ